MSDKGLVFSVNDKLNDDPISPSNVSLSIILEMADFTKQFIKGDSKIDVDQIQVSIVDGSFAIAARPTPIISDAVRDFEIIKDTGLLNNIDNKRAEIIETLQDKARKFTSRYYNITDSIASTNSNSKSIQISRDSNYKKIKTELWVDTELYLTGIINQLGGKGRTNMHLTLDNEESAIIDIDSETIKNDKENRIYKPQTIRVSAKKSTLTGKLQDIRFISFEKYYPQFDEDEYKHLIKRTKGAWKDIPDISDWVENQRGNADD
jgi:hypothetical protein